MKPQILGVENENGAQAPGVIERSEIYAISPAEAVFKAKEDTQKMHDAYRIPNQDILEDQEAARGRLMEPQALISHIQRLNSSIRVAPGGVRNAVAVRYPDKHGELQYITGFYLEPLPEYSSVTLDIKGLPHREIRGWRSVLTALIEAGALTYKQVDLTFGPARGQRSALWYRNMQHWKQHS